MNDLVICPFGHTNALNHAVNLLRKSNCKITQTPDASVTHLLLPVPSFSDDGRVVGGGKLEDILSLLPNDVTILGGKLQHPALQGYHTVDLLEDPLYLAENANITAYCAIKHVTENLPVILSDCHVLVIGWGRIGKCLASLLKSMGASVCVATRKESDRAILTALGYNTLDSHDLGGVLSDYRVIFNTAPTMLLTESELGFCSPDCLKIDLASKPGIAGSGVIWARGLPNRDAPESSGKLIARTVLRLLETYS